MAKKQRIFELSFFIAFFFLSLFLFTNIVQAQKTCAVGEKYIPICNKCVADVYPACSSPVSSNRDSCGNCVCASSTPYNCDGECRAAVPPGSKADCAPGQDYNVCAGCTGIGSVVLSPVAIQPGFISVRDDIKSSAGNLVLTNGDFVLADTKAIRVDKAGGTSSLNIGNWAAGAQGINVNLLGNINLQGWLYASSTGGICLAGTCYSDWSQVKGTKGDTGPIGPAGPAGQAGEPGIQGPIGPTGAEGAIGHQGPAGAKGDKGDAGAQGLQGIQGAKGEKGDTGDAGIQGPQGIQGEKGDIGAIGPIGPAGAQGTPGEKGEKGDTGAEGAIGVQGPAGPVAGANTQFIYNNNGSAGGAEVYYSNGKIGIGTATPNKSLHIYKTSIDNAEIDIQSVAGAGKHWAIYNESGINSLNFWANNLNVLTLANNGKVGIDELNPQYKLDVQGGAGGLINASGGFCIAGVCKTAWSQIGGEQWETISAGPNIRKMTGNVGINVSVPDYKLDVNGRMRLSGDQNDTAGIWLTKQYDASALRAFIGMAATDDTVGFYGQGGAGWGLTMNVISGNVGIGTTTPDAAALLELSSTTKGFLLPRMTNVQKNAIFSPPAGLVVYDTNNDRPYYFTSTGGWADLQGPAGPVGATGQQGIPGEKGDKGDTGAIGATGLQGPVGPAGEQGLQGQIGPAGEKGDKGDAGAIGPAGPVAGTDKQLVYNDNGSAAGANVYYDRTNNRIGIGTEVPTADFEINKEIANGWVRGLLKNTSANGIAGYMVQNDAGRYMTMVAAGTSIAGNLFGLPYADKLFLLSYGANTIIGTQQAYAISFGTNNTIRMVIAADGNIGIGTQAPSAKLEVAGQIKITGGLPGAGKVLTSDASGLASWQTPVSSGGTITGVTAGNLLIGGGTSGVVTLNVNTAGLTCADGSSIKTINSDGSVICQTDNVGGAGTITGVTAGAGLSGGGTSGEVGLSLATAACPAGQLVKGIGATLACEAPTNSGVRSIISADSKLTVGSATGDVVLSLTSDFEDGSIYDARFVNVSGDTMSGSLKVDNKGAFGGYDPDSTIALTTPSFFAGTASIGLNAPAAPANGLSVKGDIAGGGNLTMTGKVGVGIAPQTPLHISSSSEELLRIETSSAAGPVYQRFINGGGNYFVGVANSAGGRLSSDGLPYALEFVTESSRALQFATHNVARMTIGSDGNVGIGTTTPGAGYRLDVQGGKINASGGLCLNGGCITNWSQTGLWAGNSSYNYTFGRVIINTDGTSRTTTDTKGLFVAGDIHATGSITCEGTTCGGGGGGGSVVSIMAGTGLTASMENPIIEGGTISLNISGIENCTLPSKKIIWDGVHLVCAADLSGITGITINGGLLTGGGSGDNNGDVMIDLDTSHLSCGTNQSISKIKSDGNVECYTDIGSGGLYDALNQNNNAMGLDINNLGQLAIGKSLLSTDTHLLYLTTPFGQNAEINIASGNETAWGIYQDIVTGLGELKFWNGENRLTISQEGRLGIIGTGGEPTDHRALLSIQDDKSYLGYPDEGSNILSFERNYDGGLKEHLYIGASDKVTMINAKSGNTLSLGSAGDNTLIIDKFGNVGIGYGINIPVGNYADFAVNGSIFADSEITIGANAQKVYRCPFTDGHGSTSGVLTTDKDFCSGTAVDTGLRVK